MTDTQIIATTVASVGGPLGGAVYVAYLADHTEQIARSWADGREWLHARHAALWAAWDTTVRRARAAALVVLCAVLRAHGRHRAGVTA